MKRRRWILAIIVLAVAMTTCPVKAASKKDKVEKVIKTYMAGARATNGRKMGKCFKTKEGLNFTMKQARQALPYFDKVYKTNKKITYKIKAIKFSGKTAVVKVRVKSPNIKNATDKAMIDMLSYAFNNPDSTEAQSDTLFFRLVKKNINQQGVQMYKHTMIFNMVKTAKGWKINTSTDADYDLIFGRFFSIMKEYEKAFN